MDGFNGILDAFQEKKSSDDFREFCFSKFKCKLVKMIKDSGGKFDDYSISPKIRQILLHQGYELKEEEDFL